MHVPNRELRVKKRTPYITSVIRLLYALFIIVTIAAVNNSKQFIFMKNDIWFEKYHS